MSKPKTREMTHSDLVEIAKKWLRKECVVVATEMKTGWGESAEIPDAIGWDRGGWSTVIECKATRIDFLREKNKRYRKGSLGMGNKKYYLIPEGVIKTDEIPDGWGLLECRDRKRLPEISRYAPKDVNINPKYGAEIILLISCLRRIGGLRDGISVKCYQWSSKNRATLGIQNQPESKLILKDHNKMSEHELRTEVLRLRAKLNRIESQLEVDEEEIDDLVDDVIDVVLQNSYVVSEKTSDGTGKEYYDNQLFPEKGCEEKVKKLFRENIIKMKE